MEFNMTENGFQTEVNYGTLDVSGDDQYGFRPYQLMVSSIAVCSGSVLRKVFAKKRIAYDDIKIKAEVARNPDKADRIESIHLYFIVSGPDLDETKIQKSLEVTKKNCSMVQSVTGSIDISESFELVTS